MNISQKFSARFISIITVCSLLNFAHSNGSNKSKLSVSEKANAMIASATTSAEIKKAADPANPSLGDVKKAYENPEQVVAAKPAVKLVGLHIANEQEIADLLKKYSKPIAVKGIAKIKRVKLTQKALEHVFGFTIAQDDGSLLSLTGFHHDHQLKLQSQDRPFYFSGRNVDGILETFIAYKRNQFPVFKTFFSCCMARDQVIEMLIESLQNIQKVEQQDDGKRAIEGKASSGMMIRTIIAKNGELVTFYPITQTPGGAFRHEQQTLQTLFKKCFLNLENKPERKPITKEEVEELAKLYSGGIEVDWLLMGEYGLFKHDKQNEVLKNQKLIPKINITIKALAAIFSNENDAEFPAHLSRKEILQKLKEALQKVTIDKPFFLKEQDANGHHLYFLGAYSDGKDESDTFQFNIRVNEDTGDLEALYPRFG